MSLLTRIEAASFLGVSPTTFDLHVRPGLKPVRIGRCVRWTEESLRAWVDQQKGGSYDERESSGASDSQLTDEASSGAPESGTVTEPRKLRLVSTHTSSGTLARNNWRRVLEGSPRQGSNG